MINTNAPSPFLIKDFEAQTTPPYINESFSVRQIGDSESPTIGRVVLEGTG